MHAHSQDPTYTESAEVCSWYLVNILPVVDALCIAHTEAVDRPAHRHIHHLHLGIQEDARAPLLGVALVIASPSNVAVIGTRHAAAGNHSCIMLSPEMSKWVLRRQSMPCNASATVSSDQAVIGSWSPCSRETTLGYGRMQNQQAGATQVGKCCPQVAALTGPWHAAAGCEGSSGAGLGPAAGAWQRC